jgi:hypothetical protein
MWMVVKWLLEFLKLGMSAKPVTGYGRCR